MYPALKQNALYTAVVWKCKKSEPFEFKRLCNLQGEYIALPIAIYFNHFEGVPRGIFTRKALRLPLLVFGSKS
jgi:hypothetical protein